MSSQLLDQSTVERLLSRIDREELISLALDPGNIYSATAHEIAILNS